jgi:hypothetical protein
LSESYPSLPDSSRWHPSSSLIGWTSPFTLSSSSASQRGVWLSVHVGDRKQTYLNARDPKLYSEYTSPGSLLAYCTFERHSPETSHGVSFLNSYI